MRAKARAISKHVVQQALIAAARRQAIELDCDWDEDGNLCLSADLSLCCGYISPGRTVSRPAQLAVRNMVRDRLAVAGNPDVFARDFAGNMWQIRP